MKKVLLIALLAVFGMSTTVMAQSKEYQKQKAEYGKVAEKMAKKKAKELKKDKWQNSSSVDLETCLLKYYLATEPSCGGEMRGVEHTVTDAKTLSMAEKRLLLDAQSNYAQEVETLLTQTITDQASATSSDELETYIANIAAKSKHEFNGDIKRSFLIYKQNPDGKTISARAFYVIDENEGRLRAKRLAGTVKENVEISKTIEKAATGN